MYEPKCQAARDAKEIGIGGENYWRYLDKSAVEHFNHYMEEGNETKANTMLTRSLTESLQGNNGP